MEYMSSEYSSLAENSDVDSPIMNQERRKRWEEMVGGDGGDVGGGGGKSGWPEGMGEKVLEVRRPRWRSEALNEIYLTLDTIASSQSAARARPADTSLTNGNGTKAGHVAPSHKRFIMPPGLGRRGKGPRPGIAPIPGSGDGEGVAMGVGDGGEGGEGWMWASGSVGIWPDGRLVDEGCIDPGLDSLMVDSGVHGIEGLTGHHGHGGGHEEEETRDWDGETSGLVDALKGIDGNGFV